MMMGLAAEDSVNGFGFAFDFGGLNIGASFLDGFGSDACSNGFGGASEDGANAPEPKQLPDLNSCSDMGRSSII